MLLEAGAAGADVGCLGVGWGHEERARLGRAPLDLGGRPRGPGEPQQVSNGDRLGQSCPVHRRGRETRETVGLVTGGGVDTRPELGSEPGEVRASLTQGQGKRGLWGVRTPPEVPGSQGMSGAGWSSGQDRGAGPSPGGGHAQDEQRWPRQWCVGWGVLSWKPWGHMAQRGASRECSEPDWDGGCRALKGEDGVWLTWPLRPLREKARLWPPGRPALAHLLAEACLPCCPGCLLTVSAPPVSPSPGASPPGWSPGTCPRPWVLEPMFGGPCEDLAFDLREVGTLGRLGQGRDHCSHQPPQEYTLLLSLLFL